jgi:hypothetical protein
MKQQFFLLLVSFISINSIHAQNSIEDSTLVNSIDPIWVLTDSNDTLIDYSTIDFLNYPNDATFDLNRQSQQTFFQQTLNQNDSSLFTINGASVNVDNVNYYFTGNATIIPLGTVTVINSQDTLYNLNKLNLIEDYFLIDSSNDTVATYKNKYYCYVDQLGIVHLEIYDKRRTIKNRQTESFLGIGVNDFTSQLSSIGLSLSPNPISTSTVAANFSLPTSGLINISISNQVGTINDLIHSSNQSNGAHSVLLDISNYPSGNYEIIVNYNFQNFSQTLIKQ